MDENVTELSDFQSSRRFRLTALDEWCSSGDDTGANISLTPSSKTWNIRINVLKCKDDAKLQKEI